MIVRIQPDKQKALSLQTMAMITLKRLETTDMLTYPSNTVNDYYDSIHKLLEALALREGVKIKGEGAHQELIDYITKTNRLDEQTRLFIQQLRDYRNRIAYEGFTITKNYVLLHQEKIKRIIEILLNKLKKE